jgi:DNA modification methylase
MYTTKDDLIYEPYAGSGTTIIAAQMMGRIVRAVELDPLYCELIAQRFEKFTGIKREVVAR